MMENEHNTECHEISGSWLSDRTAYIRAEQEDGYTYYVVCRADGRTLAIAPTRDMAFAITRQNDFVPQDAH